MKLIIALPGNSFSNKFLINWSDTLISLNRDGHQVSIVNGYSSFVPFARMQCLGLNVLKGIEQKPFNDGKYDYDLFITIDSDIFFTYDHIKKLIDASKKYPVVSGVYKMEDLKHYACVKEWNTDFYLKNGTFEFMTDAPTEQYVKVAYTGLGFFACRKGVIESLEYPYFNHPLIEIKTEDGKILRDMCSEDVAFCKNIIQAGYDIVVDTELRVGHEKKLVI